MKYTEPGDSVYLVEDDGTIVSGTVTVVRSYNANVRVGPKVRTSVPMDSIFETRTDAETALFGLRVEGAQSDIRRKARAASDAASQADRQRKAVEDAKRVLIKLEADYAEGIAAVAAAEDAFRAALNASAAHMFGKGVTLKMALDLHEDGELVIIGHRGRLQCVGPLTTGTKYRVVRP